MPRLHHYNYTWVNNANHFVIVVVLLLQVPLEVEGDGDLGAIECVDGKWKVDTRLMALVMTCPLPLDGNADSVMKMAKCAMNKLGIYDGQDLSEDFTETTCSIFVQPKLKKDCLSHANDCATFTFVRFNWETLWPAFATCFLPWMMGLVSYNSQEYSTSKNNTRPRSL